VETSLPPPSITFLVPVYNSAGTLNNVVKAVAKEGLKVGGPFELILVNDGSVDASWNVIKMACAQHSWVKGINMARNFGQHNALLCGIRQAKYEIVITLDDDLQNPVSEIHKLVEKLCSEELHVVYGVPMSLHHGFFRNIASQMTKLVLQQAMGAETARQVSAFRAFKTTVRDGFANYHNPFINIDVLLTWGASKFGRVYVEHHPRAEGKSSYTLAKLITHAVNMVTGFSTLPLQLASINGFVLMALGACLLAYVILRYVLQGSPVPGFPFLASIIIVFSGAQLLALGIIGEYVGRIYARTMDRPPYQIDAMVQGADSDVEARAEFTATPKTGELRGTDPAAGIAISSSPAHTGKR
jgi:glycosyltransferase involved in cell wall biosynthesis